MADLNVILKYRRPQVSWLCPECDAENALVYTSCCVCGCAKSGTPTLVEAWSPADETPIMPPPPKPPAGKGKVIYVPPVSPVPPAKDSSGSNVGIVIIWTIVIILAIVLIAAMIASGIFS